MSGALPDLGLAAVVLGGLVAAFALNEARHVLRDRRRDRKTPVPGNATPPQVAAPRSQPRQTPAPGPHGPHIATVNIWADGYTTTRYTTTGHTEIHRGECAECAAGTCTWCGFYPMYDNVRGRVVHQYQKCPAHQDKERQP